MSEGCSSERLEANSDSVGLACLQANNGLAELSTQAGVLGRQSETCVLHGKLSDFGGKIPYHRDAGNEARRGRIGGVLAASSVSHKRGPPARHAEKRPIESAVGPLNR